MDGAPRRVISPTNGVRGEQSRKKPSLEYILNSCENRAQHLGRLEIKVCRENYWSSTHTSYLKMEDPRNPFNQRICDDAVDATSLRHTSFRAKDRRRKSLPRNAPRYLNLGASLKSSTKPKRTKFREWALKCLHVYIFLAKLRNAHAQAQNYEYVEQYSL